MTNKALAARLREHANLHREHLPQDHEQQQWTADLDRAADLIEQMAQAKPSRSERLREAGFTPRDKRIACDECGQLVSQQFLPIHKCEQRGEPLSDEQVRTLVQTMDWPPSVTEIVRAVEQAHGIRSEK